MFTKQPVLPYLSSDSRSHTQSHQDTSKKLRETYDRIPNLRGHASNNAALYSVDLVPITTCCWEYLLFLIFTFTGWPKKMRTHILFDKKIHFLTNVFSVAGRERWTYGWSFAAIVALKMSWTNQQKIFSLETYFATKSYQSVQIQFRKRFHCRNFPSKSTIVSWIKKFREHGTVVHLCSKATGGTYSGRKKSSRTEKNIAALNRTQP